MGTQRSLSWVSLLEPQHPQAVAWVMQVCCNLTSCSFEYYSIEYNHDWLDLLRIMSGFVGAIVSGGKGTAAAKFEALSAAGALRWTVSRRSLFVVDSRVVFALIVITDANYHVYVSGVTVVRSPDILGKTMRDLFIARGIAITPKWNDWKPKS